MVISMVVSLTSVPKSTCEIFCLTLIADSLGRCGGSKDYWPHALEKGSNLQSCIQRYV